MRKVSETQERKRSEVADVDAIHPGYGFLSENSHFAEKCRDSGYEFIGPTVEAMERLGDKNAARAMAKECGVPIVPGSDGLIESESQALACARKIGYPVLVKASAGGGGRGIRQANDDRQLRRALQEASREAATAFGVADVYIEKFIENPRHVEAQLLADNYGNAIHLWERDCSIQRRRQKLVELTPAPAMTLEKRKALCESAVRIAKAAGYTNAGTVEFIVDSKGDFYFIEMNARIQVEHPVTEMATGVDLIQQQIRIASGEKLEIRQEDVVHRGFAMECRINAEDAAGLHLAIHNHNIYIQIPEKIHEKYKANLEDRILKMGLEITTLEKRLESPNYVTKAPKELVEETRKSLADKKSLLEKAKAELELI